MSRHTQNYSGLASVAKVDAWIQSDNYGFAIDALNDVQSRLPRSSEAQRCWAEIYILRDKNYVLAEEHAARAIAYDKKNPNAYVVLAKCLVHEKKYIQALRLIIPVLSKDYHFGAMALFCKIAAHGYGKKQFSELMQKYYSQIRPEQRIHLDLNNQHRKIDEVHLHQACRTLDPRGLARFRGKARVD